MNNYSKIAIIVLNYNCADTTIKCVDQLLSFKSEIYIIIVDNNSTDHSYDILKKRYQDYKIDVIETGTNGGYGAGNNYGIKYAINQYNISYFAIINPDVIVPNDSVIERLLNTISNNQECAVAGAVVINSGNSYNPANSAWKVPRKIEFILSRCIFLKKLQKEIINWKFNCSKTVEVDCISGCFFIASVSAFEKIGFFDEEIFMYNEEILIGHRLKHLGYKEILHLDEFVYHNHPIGSAPTIKNFFPARKKRFKSDTVLYKKIYSDRLGLIAIYLLEYINRIVLFPWFLIRSCVKKNNLEA